MKKRLFALLTVLVLLAAVPGITALGEAAQEWENMREYVYTFREEVKMEGKTVPMVIDYIDDEEAREREFTVYYVEGGDIPYVALKDFMPVLSHMITFGEKDIEEEIGSNLYTINAADGDLFFPEHYYTVSRTAPFSAMVLDVENDTIAFSNFNKFTLVPGITALVTALDLPEPKATDLGAWLELYAAAQTDEEKESLDTLFDELIMANKTGDKELFHLANTSFNISGDPQLFNLRDYGIDLVEQDGECYVPMQTMSDLFLSPFYCQLIFNGEKLYLLLYVSDLTDELNSVAEEPQMMSEEFAMFNYGELRFLLDVHYGLKAEHGITDFGEYFKKTGLAKDLMSTDPVVFDKAIIRLTHTFMDDGHSGFAAPSWRSGNGEAIGEMGVAIFDAMGPSSLALNNAGSDYSSARGNAYPGDIPMYQEIGDTAIITFDGFYYTMDSIEDYYDPDLKLDPAEFVIPNAKFDYDLDELIGGTEEETAEEGTAAEASAEETAAEPAEETADESEEESAPAEPLPVDTIKLFLYAWQQISREDSPVKNVIIDLSNNGGGSALAAVFVASFIRGRADIALKDMTTGAQTIMTYRVDLNLDNYFDGRESMYARDVKVYCLISPNSFSCGNLIPAFCKGNYITVVGQASGGGSCVVLPCCSASGTIFQISGSKQLSIARNGSFYNIDRGIEPDIYLTTPQMFYDREGLIRFLKTGSWN